MKSIEIVKKKIMDLADDLQHYSMVQHDVVKEKLIKLELEEQRLILNDLEKLEEIQNVITRKYTFTKATGNGQSQCQKCGTVSWDCFMYKVKEFDDHRVCGDCKKHMEDGTEDEIQIRWKGFKPNY